MNPRVILRSGFVDAKTRSRRCFCFWSASSLFPAFWQGQVECEEILEETESHSCSGLCTWSLETTIIIKTLGKVRLRIGDGFNILVRFGLRLHLKVHPCISIFTQLNQEEAEVISRAPCKYVKREDCKATQRECFLLLSFRLTTLSWILDGRVRLLGNMLEQVWAWTPEMKTKWKKKTKGKKCTECIFWFRERIHL